jgi:hypothetical protein
MSMCSSECEWYYYAESDYATNPVNSGMNPDVDNSMLDSLVEEELKKMMMKLLA